MAEETTKPKGKKEKPPAPEDKPFPQFIEEEFQPALREALAKEGIETLELNFVKDKLPISGAGDEECAQVVGTWCDRRFNIYFFDEDIGGDKGFSYAVGDSQPSTLESFMIDERKVSLDLLVMYTIQRLNGQKWLSRN